MPDTDHVSRLAVLEHRADKAPCHDDLRSIEEKASKHIDDSLKRFSQVMVEKMGLQSAQFDTKLAELTHSLKTHQAEMFEAFENKLEARREEAAKSEKERKDKQQQLVVRGLMVVGALVVAAASGGDALSWLRFFKIA